MKKHIKKKLIKKLMLEGGIPQNWLDGRRSSNNTEVGTTPRDDDEGTNFRKDNSGQPDLEEHHYGEFSDEVLQSSIENFLDVIKPKNPKAYEVVEKIIEKYFQDSIPSMNESEELTELAVLRSNDLKDLLPTDIYSHKDRQERDNKREIVDDLKNLLNGFYTKHNINIQIK